MPPFLKTTGSLEHLLQDFRAEQVLRPTQI
jgi:hypothetical protein